MMRALRFVCAAWILPAGFSLIAFFGFFTNYTTDVFSAAGLAGQYQRSVFQYRIVGRYLVSSLAGVFEPIATGWPVPRALLLLDPLGDAATYWAYVVVHTLATCIGCSLLLVALRHRVPAEAEAPELMVAGVGMAVAMAAFVVTPYDGVFFAFQMAAVLITLTVSAGAALLPLVVVTALATLTRESAYFIPVFFLAVYHREIAAGDRAARAALVASSGAVVVAYIGVRAFVGWSGASSVFYAWQWWSNLKWTSLMGTAMLAASLVLLLGRGRNARERAWFAGLSLPYFVFVHVFAEPWEWRLWIPVLVPLLVLRVIPERASAPRQTGYHV